LWDPYQLVLVRVGTFIYEIKDFRMEVRNENEEGVSYIMKVDYDLK
jgi:hypothetical protein